jgi:hypothetical protein
MKTEQLIEMHEEAIMILEAIQESKRSIDSLNDSIIKLAIVAPQTTIQDWRIEIKHLELSIIRFETRYENLMKS